MDRQTERRKQTDRERRLKGSMTIILSQIMMTLQSGYLGFNGIEWHVRSDYLGFNDRLVFFVSYFGKFHRIIRPKNKKTRKRKREREISNYGS